jgi:hypothetical protein
MGQQARRMQRPLSLNGGRVAQRDSREDRFCEGFRMTAHRDGSACTGAVVRKPSQKLTSVE